MKRTNLKRALLASAALLLVTTGAYGQSPNANPHAKGNADPAAKNAAAAPGAPAAAAAAPGAPGAKADEKGKADEAKSKLDDKKGEAKGEAKGAADRATRKAKQLEDEKAKLKLHLKAPMDEAAKQQLRRHAERVAKLERIKSLAETAKDTEGAERATKLLAKENANYEKWMAKLSAAPGATPAAAAVPGTAPAAPDSKGGAK